MTLSFQPINDAHAIVELVFFFNFSSDFKNESLSKLKLILKDKYRHFTKDTPVYKLEHQVKINSQNNPSIDSKQTLSGFELETFGEDEKLEWGLSVSDNKLLIHCLNYSTWEKVWEEAFSYISDVFEVINSESSFKVSNFGLKYLDKFTHYKEEESHSITDLFKSDNKFITSSILNSGRVWHCNSGWFEDLLDDFTIENLYFFKCLNQLNVESNLNIKDSNEIVISVDHGTFIIPKKIDNNIQEYGIEVSKIDINYINNCFQLLHRKNKTVLRELLSNSMCKRINLY